MRLPNEKINEIARVIDIVDIISYYIPVKKRGKSFVAVCPFHPDKNPSLHISPEKQVYHCFACKASGNVFRFVQDYEKISFQDAVLKLAERAGIQININANNKVVSDDISKLYDINKLAAKYFHKNLLDLKGSEKEFISGYLKKRGLSKNGITNFGLGYASRGWNNLLSYFLDDGTFSADDILAAGLVKSKEKGKYYDTFRGRLVFPIFNESDKVVGFGARKLYEDDEVEGKYINTQETKVYQKRQILYGLNLSKDSIRKNDFVIIVEGYFDVISLAQNNILNVVASSGTALTPEQVHLLSRYTKNIILIFDSDSAGIKAAKAGLQIILEAGLDLNIVSLPEGEDPDSFIRNKGKNEFIHLLNTKKSIINFISDIYVKENRLNTPEEKTEFVKEIISYIARIPDKLKRTFYIKEITKKFGLYESDMRDELDSAIARFKKENFPKSDLVLPAVKNDIKDKVKEFQKIPKDEIELLEIFINGNSEALEYLEYNLETDFITDKTVRKIVFKFLDGLMNEGKIEVKNIMNGHNDDKYEMILSRLSVHKYDLSEYEKLDKNSLIYHAGNQGNDYLKKTKDLLKKMRIKQIEKEIIEIKKNGGDPNIIVEKKREILEIKKSDK
ncbi:MAG: DNA primase [Ignavibacteria bacterium]|nr:DNA primase [Ignavibacteria bacterium]